jgi:hypothetical protein
MAKDPCRSAVQNRFIRALRAQPDVKRAARLAGTDVQTIYFWKRTDRAFRDSWESALEEAVDELEGIALQRAKTGSDTLLMFMLRAHRPQTYRDQLDISKLPDNVIIRLLERGFGKPIEGAPALIAGPGPEAEDRAALASGEDEPDDDDGAAPEAGD